MVVSDLEFIAEPLVEISKFLIKPMKIFNTTLSCLIIIVLSGLLSTVYAQDNNKLTKANTLFKAKRFAEAIPLYEEVLERDFNKTVVLKLARSHRQLNNLPEALKHFSTLIAQPEVKTDHQIEYVEMLIMNSDYKQAQAYLAKIPSTNTSVQQIFKLSAMINNNFELDSLYKNVRLESFAHNTAESDENSPFFLDNKMIFTSDQSPVNKIKNKSGMTGRAYYKIWESDLEGNTYKAPKPFNKSVNAANKNTANAVFDIKNQKVIFSKNDNTKDRNSFYNMQLYSSEIKGNKFGKAEKLPVNSPQYNYMHPCVSANGKTLLYVSDKKGQGGTDIFISKRTKDGWSRGKNLGSVINTESNEGFPFLDKDDNLYFCSKGHSGLGGYDIFYAKQKSDGTYEKPVNLGRPFNSQHDDISIFFKKDGYSGAFTSSRNGSDDIFLFTIDED